MSTALYILAISPLIKHINNDSCFAGTCVDHAHEVTAIAYTDDITVIIKKTVKDENASGTKLNHNKTEGVWSGVESDRQNINMEVKQEIKILGLNFCNSERNWEK